MTPALFWTLAGGAGALALLTAAIRRLTSGSGVPAVAARTGGLLAGIRDRVASARPVNLETWPEALAARAMRSARPVPGGRATASSYQVRCGGSLYGAVAPHVPALRGEFGRLLQACVPTGAPAPSTRIAFVYDETLRPESYRLDMEFPNESPAGCAVGGTVVHVPPATPVPAAPADPGSTRPECSDWSLTVPDGRLFTMPATGTVTLGADPSCDVVLDDRFVSGRHLRAGVQGDALVLRDGAVTVGPDGREHGRCSTNHTFLRDHPIAVATLRPGDGPARVRLGPTATVEFRHLPTAVTEPMGGTR